MELEGYGLVANAIEIALAIRHAVNNNPLISKYFRVLGADAMVPAQYRQSGFVDYLAPGVNWANTLKSLDEDEFCLDPTRMTLVCGTAGYDGTQFKGILASEYNIQVNKTSRNSVLLQSNINNTRSDVAHLIRVLAEIAGEVDRGLKQGGANGRGGVVAEYCVKPDLWFFGCHFKGDPVMPGCLGLDALWQLLGFFLGWLGAPGRGVVEFGPYLREIKALGIDGAVSIELEYSPEPDRIADWVREAYTATDKLMRDAGLRG